MKKYCMRCMRIIDKGDVCPNCGEFKPQRKLPHVLLPGTTLKGRYLIGNALGQGGFGITYIGCDLLLNLRVAIKEYYPNGCVNRNVASSTEVTVTDAARAQAHEDGKDKFLREAQVLAEFQEEEGIVDVRDYFKENNTAYIVMEYLNGITLQQCLEHKALAPELILDILRPVMSSLDRIHDRHVVHRDISPDNIMVLRSGKLKLMDFGAARQVDFNDQKSLSVVLKTGFAPVEQYRPRGELGPWTDVYALCATIYMCMTRKLPENSLERVFEDSMPWPSELGVPIPPAVETVLKKGMAVRWKDRYRSVSELRKAFDAAWKEPQDIQYDGPGETNMESLTHNVSKALDEKEEKEKNEVWSKHASCEYAPTVVAVDDPSDQPDIVPVEPTGSHASEQRKTPIKPKAEKTLRRRKKKTTGKPLIRRIKKHSKWIAAAVLAAAVLTGAIWGLVSLSRRNTQPAPPSYMIMLGDAKTLLEDSGIAGTVSSMDVIDKVYNEKFGTYKADCLVTASNAQQYTVSLVYDELDNGWSCSKLSRIH